MTIGNGSAGADPAGGGDAAPRAIDTSKPSPPATEGDEGFVLQLPAFQGPLDLLLRLIEREELDVTSVSVFAVTEQYLSHLRSAESMALSALAEFVAMGARLLLLKSRALLPRDGSDRDGSDEEQGDDDAAGLIAALQEYQRYKRAAEHLHDLEEEHRSGYRREAARPQVQLPTGLDSLTLDALVDLFRDVLERLPEPQEQPRVEREPVRLADRVDSIVGLLERDGRASFQRLVEGASTRLDVIVSFLAVLELIKAQFIEARQPDAFGDIELVRISGGTAPTEADLAEDFGDV